MSIGDRTAAQSEWIARRDSTVDPGARVFCIPYAGGGPAAYFAWTQLLPEDIDFCAIRLPGRESRLLEPPIDDLDHIATRLAGEIDGWLDLPFVFVGDCSGGLIMLEVTRALRSGGRSLPAGLYAGACPAPQLPRTAPTLHDLPLDELVAEMGTYGAMDADVGSNPELLELLEPMLRADLAASERAVYRPDDPLPVPITVFGGLRDHLVAPGELLPWCELTTAAFTLRLLDAGHFVLTTSPEAVTAVLADDLRHFVQDRAG